jgi:processive rubber oxygenase RoxA-like protein
MSAPTMARKKLEEPLSPVEREEKRLRRRRLIICAIIVAALALFLYFRYSPNRPVTYSGIEDHFKYGSIGSDIENGLPLEIIRVLPRMFPEYLPPGAPPDYTAFGFIQEPGRDMPIGFSTRRVYLDRIGLNCAACHTGVVRESESSQPLIISGMPSNTVDLQAFFEFLFKCVADSRFTPDNIVEEIDRDRALFFIDRLIYKSAVPAVQAGLLVRKAQLDAFMGPDHPRFGPGRVDTFNPYKTNQFSEYYRQDGVPLEERFGTADFPSAWNQGPREGLNLHWDGNNSSVMERNFSAAFGAGATRNNVDSRAILRIKEWFDVLPPPPYPFEKSDDAQVLARGEAVYMRYCFECHDFKGKDKGEVVPLEQIGTDEHRLNSYTEKLAELQLAYGKGYAWEFKNFKKTNGYTNVPLDGIWARAPYLHNGSVPTIWDLLTPAERRNNNQPSFYTGHGVYDKQNMGFRTDVSSTAGRRAFLYVIAEKGNSNKGHTGERFGTDLSDTDKRALIEYLKTK